jgi:transaldolase
MIDLRPPPNPWSRSSPFRPGTPESAVPTTELVGPDVINTMPEQTLRAFADHGDVARTLDVDATAAEATHAAAAAAGIDLSTVTAELEREVVRSLCDSYHELLDCIERKLGMLAAVGD